MFVETTFVFNKFAIVLVVTFALVICALAVVIPVLAFKVAVVMFVVNKFVIVAVVELKPPATSNNAPGVVVPIPTLPTLLILIRSLPTVKKYKLPSVVLGEADARTLVVCAISTTPPKDPQAFPGP